MKVIIVTVLKSPNSGSFLQAWALYRYLEEQGFDSYFLESGTRKPLEFALKRSVRFLLNGQFGRLKNVWIQTYNFHKSIKEIRQITADKISDDDIFVLGSDEIWNLDRLEMAKYKVFWGDGLNRKRAIAYAPSLNGASESKYIDNDFVKKSLEELHRISVRDNYSASILSKVTKKTIEVVCDPTVLLDVNEYVKRETNIVNGEYILVYLPDALVKDSDKELISAFAHSVGLPLVSFHYYNTWCDQIVPSDEKNFLEYIHKAKLVITSTFHGATFSILFNKDFIAYDKGSSKLRELLSTYGLESRLFHPSTDSPDKLTELYKAKTDHDSVNFLLNKKRLEGREYLTNSIETLLGTNN